MTASPVFSRLSQPLPLLLLLSGLLFFFRLGSPGLMDPDEGRYAEIAREMLVSGDFITPQLNFLPYLEKPPLVYWLTAVSLWLGGMNEWAARCVPALSALAGVGAVYWLGCRLWGRETAFWGGMVTATSSGYFLLGRILTLDMTLTALVTWAVVLGYLAVRDQQRRYLPWAYLAMGLGVLAKGPVALALPVLIFGAWFLLRKQWRGLWQLWHTGGVALLVLLVAPWYLLVAWQNPDFLYYFFFQEHLQRYLTPRIHAGQPFYFYLGVLITGFFPWIFLLPWAWRATSPGSGPDSTAEASDRLFLAVWSGVIFLFFSLARAKLFPYLLPALPPLAPLVGRALTGQKAWEMSSSPWWTWSLRIWLTLAGLLAAGVVALMMFLPHLGEKIAFLSPLPLLFALALVLTPLVLFSHLVAVPKYPYILLCGAVILNLILMWGLERLADIRSPRALAQFINVQRQADTIILGYQHYSQGISFYTGQPLYLFGIRGELDFGLGQRPQNPYYLSTLPQVAQLLKPPRDFMVIIDPENYKIFQTITPQPVTILTQWKNYLLIRNL